MTSGLNCGFSWGTVLMGCYSMLKTWCLLKMNPSIPPCLSSCLYERLKPAAAEKKRYQSVSEYQFICPGKKTTILERFLDYMKPIQRKACSAGQRACFVCSRCKVWFPEKPKLGQGDQSFSPGHQNVEGTNKLPMSWGEREEEKKQGALRAACPRHKNC